MNKKLLHLFSLKFNPFSPDVPLEALRKTPSLESFFWKFEQTLARDGGFALITGEPGTGKSVVLRLLAERLSLQPELVTGVLSRPQANVADFYREMGDVFSVPLRPHNRWAGAKSLRERWQAHLDTTLVRPVLLIDEAQEMKPVVLNELRLLLSSNFDSRQLLTVVLAGDGRLLDKLRHDDLLPLSSRIRSRLALDYLHPEELQKTLVHLITAAGNPTLMTRELIATLAEHSFGNLRVLTSLAAELLSHAAHRELPQLDEKLYFEVFSPPSSPSSKKGSSSRLAARS